LSRAEESVNWSTDKFILPKSQRVSKANKQKKKREKDCVRLMYLFVCSLFLCESIGRVDWFTIIGHKTNRTFCFLFFLCTKKI